MQTKKTSSTDKNIVDKTKRKSASSRLVADARQSAKNRPAGEIAYEYERLCAYALNHVNARLALPVFVLIVTLVMVRWTGWMLAGWWAASTILAYGLNITMGSRFLGMKREDVDILRWRRNFLIAQGVLALCWSLFAVYQCDICGTDYTFLIIQFSAVLVFQAVTMILAFPFGASVLLTSAPATIAFALAHSMSYDIASLVMGGIAVTSQGFFYLVADRFRLSTMSELAHRHEREDLIAELETAKSISEEARRRAEEANMAKSRFLATMSHELRTPLNAILGFSEVMQTEVLGPVGNDTYKGYVDDIHSSGNHLLNVINEILDLSRIEAGRQELQEEAIRLSHVVDDAIHMVDLKAKNKNITLTSDFENDMPQIWADEKAIRQIALNLLSNALKFTPPGGRIAVRVGWTSTGGQYLSVRDSGPGIPAEEIPIVLSSFGQGSIAIKSAEQGSGLGLPIVQALVHMHDGRFDLKSKLREGTEAIATFPRSRILEVMERTENTGTAPRPRQPITSLQRPTTTA